MSNAPLGSLKVAVHAKGVAAAYAGEARTRDGIQFVDEHNGGGALLGAFKKVAHARSAHAHEHFHEFRT